MRRTGPEAHTGEPLESMRQQALLIETRMLHLLRRNKVLFGDHLGAAPDEWNATIRPQIALVPAISEISMKEIFDGLRFRHVRRPYVALEQNRTFRTYGGANILHDIWPDGRIDHRFAQPGGSSAHGACVHPRFLHHISRFTFRLKIRPFNPNGSRRHAKASPL
jgi:hypothetical protein